MHRRFDGFRHTPFLWIDLLQGLQMYKADERIIADSPRLDSSTHFRLGKLIEQFVLFEWQQDDSIQLLKSNVQIFRDQITIGELDGLIKKMGRYIHLEIVYKFYLYDPSITTALNRWIGPNRNDSLVQKLQKLKDKQFPLLYHTETKKLLNDLHVKAEEFQQQLYFKAQLFVPFHSLDAAFPFINNDCIQGFYIRFGELYLFTHHSFYLPSKLDWLIEPHVDVSWVSMKPFQAQVSTFLESTKAPLCWMKSPAGKIQKFFVVWWK